MTTLSSLVPRMALLQVLEITGVVTFFLFVPVLTHGFGAEAVVSGGRLNGYARVTPSQLSRVPVASAEFQARSDHGQPR